MPPHAILRIGDFLCSLSQRPVTVRTGRGFFVPGWLRWSATIRASIA